MIRRRSALSCTLALTACTFTALTTACSAPEPYSGEVPPVAATSTVQFGQSAELVTRDIGHGVPVSWQATVFAPERIDATPDYPEVLCHTVTLSPTFIGDYPVDVTVPVPEFTAVNGELNANFIKQDEAPALCGVAEEAPDGYTGDLEVGHEYRIVVASWDGLYGLPATEITGTAGEQTVTWHK